MIRSWKLGRPEARVSAFAIAFYTNTKSFAWVCDINTFSIVGRPDRRQVEMIVVIAVSWI
jgi:hypothetical protein